MSPSHRLLQALSDAHALRSEGRSLATCLQPLLTQTRQALGCRWLVVAELVPSELGDITWRQVAGPGDAGRGVHLHADAVSAVLAGQVLRHEGPAVQLCAGQPATRAAQVVPLWVDGEPRGALVAGDVEGRDVGEPVRWVWSIVSSWLDDAQDARDAGQVVELQRLNDELRRRVGELARLDREHKLLADFASFLGACHGVSDAHEVLQRFLPALFEGSSGAYFARAGTLLEQEVGWGRGAGSAVHGVDDCWALRRGEPHVVHGAADLSCPHCLAAVQGRGFCVPVVSREGPVGLIHVEVPAQGESDRSVLRMLGAVADRLGACLTNLKLRDRLQQESIRDPLTGLFNRRYMVETLERELARARRATESVAVVMMDVDHFKRLNDQYGHDVGDDVLQAVATELGRGVRSEDVVCRYGGEEFVAILPGATLALATQRAEELRLRLHSMAVQARDGSTPEVTMSAGVAVADRGATPEIVLRAADRALLRAKQEGRDQVCVSAAPQLPSATWEQAPSAGALRAIAQ